MGGIANLWRHAPWTIKAYAAIQIIAVVSSFLLQPDDAHARSLGGLIFSLLLTAFILYWLLHRSRVTRVFMVVWTSLGLLASIGLLVRGQRDGYSLLILWIGIALASIIVLMHPATRAWCDRRLKLTDPDRLSRTGTSES